MLAARSNCKALKSGCSTIPVMQGCWTSAAGLPGCGNSYGAATAGTMMQQVCLHCCCRAKDHKARNGIVSAVISMSIAGPRSAALNDAVEAAAAAGITVVTAAGKCCKLNP